MIFLGDYGRPVVLLTSSCVAWHYILLSLCVRACARACVYSCNHHEDNILFIKHNRHKSVQGDVTQAAQFMEECGEGGGGLEREEENSIR